MTKLTAKQTEVLNLIKTVGIKGRCINMVWRWLRADNNCVVNGGTIKALERAGSIYISYYSGGEAEVRIQL